MPRSVKSLVDKRGLRSSSQVSTPPIEDLEVEDIIPGRLTKAQWTDLLIQEDSDEIVGEIMEELFSKVMEGCFKVHIKKQLAPFSAFWAKSYLTEIVEQQIMCLDDEEQEEAAKTEDSEPTATILDTWAQGCVPVIKVADIGNVSQIEPSLNQQCKTTVQKSSSPKQSKEQTSPERPLTDKHYTVLTPCPPPKMNRKKLQPVNLHPKPVQSKLLPPLSCSVEKKNRVLASTNGKHSVSSPITGSSYQLKDRKPIPKLDPSCLPRHCIFPQHEIVDKNYSQSISKKPRANKQQSERTEISLKPLTSSKDEPAKFQRSQADVWLKKLSTSKHRKEGVGSSGPLRLDTMDLAKGVSFHESQTVDINPAKRNPSAHSTDLSLIRSDAAVPLFSIDQVTQGPSPHSLFQFKNCNNS
ncbi:uncharacterized protein C2orf81 homolog isoform X2 [Labrus mixtus]|uniref:uncharacterized protein C2orf81 homolog isoform X2 n=1 Tax=Labrus mixtus TaxID=508554 RepID=UPI0029C00B6C|nr:uncharacterized protein C2orf81 homolog isoform X2 [Labrus mixtus]